MKKRKIIFFMRNVGYLRNFDSTLVRLAELGYELQVMFDQRKETVNEKPALEYIDALGQRFKNISFCEMLSPNVREEFRPSAVLYLRLTLDYLRYLDPRFKDAEKLRQRAANHAPEGLKKLTDLLARGRWGRGAVATVLAASERNLPPPLYLLEFLRRNRPDLVLITPLVGLGSNQNDYVKACRHLGIRSCLCVASWDNLTSKGLIQSVPDAVMVWNEAQRQEASELHGVPADRVFVTGAHTYDHWFDWRPSQSAEAFKERVGLTAEDPYILYLGSSLFIAPNERPFVERWMQAVRESHDPMLRQAGILIRPHPQNFAQWENADLARFGNVAVWPPKGANPVGREAKSDYFDSLYHSRLVVGVNTSGLVEAGILGKPVHTVLSPENAETQDGTLHFQLLRSYSGGLLHVAESFDEHLRLLSETLKSESAVNDKSRQFISGFVRPLGLDRSATEILVERIEALAALPPPKAMMPSLLTRLARPLATGLTLICWPDFRRNRRVYRIKMKRMQKAKMNRLPKGEGARSLKKIKTASSRLSGAAE